MTTDLVHRLQGIVDSSVENDGNRAIARYLLQHLASLEKLSVQSIAEDCYASIATVSRFVRGLGFESFSQLKKQSARYRMMTADAAQKIPAFAFPADGGERGKEGVLLSDYTGEIAAALTRYTARFDYAGIDRLVTLLRDCRSVALFGIYQPGLLARHLQFLFLSAGRYTEYYDLCEDHAERARTMTAEDLAIVFSVDGNYLNGFGDTIRLMRGQGVRLALVTQNPDVAQRSLFEEVLFLGEQDSGQAGCYKLQLFTEALFSRYVARCQPPVRDER